MKILFTSTHLTSFIRDDLNLLRRHCDVEHLITLGIRSLFAIAAAVRRADVTLTWFASVYAAAVVFCARRWNKRSIIIVGGVDVANLPEIGYGLWRSPWKSVLVRYALRAADRVLVVDPSLRRAAMQRAEYDGGNIRYVPTGYDAERWVPAGEKEPFIITVANCEDDVRLRVKGIPFLIDAAKKMTDVRFVVVGVAEHLRQRVVAPPNVTLMPFVDQPRLLEYYQRAKVYCQPSLSEGLPNSLCEAMLCGCIPVGTMVGGIPSAITNPDFLVPYGDVEALAAALRRALDAPPDEGYAARRFIAETFPLTRREEALVHIIRTIAA